tara:strand:- start:461 stop:664 length:204 start_codon:yes stop_codon:yes gene_type:complete
VKKQPRSWLVFSGLAFEIAIIMYFFLKAGFYLDSIALWGLEIYSLLLSIVAILVIIWLILFQTKNLK